MIYDDGASGSAPPAGHQDLVSCRCGAGDGVQFRPQHLSPSCLAWVRVVHSQDHYRILTQLGLAENPQVSFDTEDQLTRCYITRAATNNFPRSSTI